MATLKEAGDQAQEEGVQLDDCSHNLEHLASA
jgi:hypothetical protein